MIHHNARPPVKVRKHERRTRAGKSRRFAECLLREERWFIEMIEEHYNYPSHPEPDGA